MSLPAIQMPRSFNRDQESMLRDLERLTAELKKYTDELSLTAVPRPDILPLIANGSVHARFDGVYRFNPPTGLTVNMFLPSPDRAQAGRVVHAIRTGVDGLVVIYAPGCLVNGRARVILDSSIGWSQFIFDGQNYYGDKSHGIPSDEDI